jgi:hypothetical protein
MTYHKNTGDMPSNASNWHETERATFFEMARAWLRAASVIDDTLPRYRVHLLDCARLERASATGTKNDR